MLVKYYDRSLSTLGCGASNFIIQKFFFLGFFSFSLPIFNLFVFSLKVNFARRSKLCLLQLECLEAHIPSVPISSFP